MYFPSHGEQPWVKTDAQDATQKLRRLCASASSPCTMIGMHRSNFVSWVSMIKKQTASILLCVITSRCCRKVSGSDNTGCSLNHRNFLCLSQKRCKSSLVVTLGHTKKQNLACMTSNISFDSFVISSVHACRRGTPSSPKSRCWKSLGS